MDTPAFPRRAVVSLAGLVAVAYGTQLYALSVMVTGKAAGGEFSISLLSAGFGGAAVVAGLSAPLVGRIADRHSVRGLIGFGALLSGAAFGLLAIATSGWQIIAAFWLLLGPATAMTGYEPAYVAIGQWVFATDRNRAIALVSVVGGLAGPIFIPLTGWMVTTIGWRLASGALGATMVVVGGIGAFLFLPKGGPGAETEFVSRSVPWRRFLDDRRLFAFSAAVLVSFGVLSSVFLHRVAVFEESGFDVRYVAFLAGMSSLFTFPGRWLAPRMAEKVPAISIFVGACAALAGVMLFAVAAKPAWVMWAFFALFGVFFGALLPMRAVIMNEWYAGDDFGLLMGKQWALAALAGGAMPWVGGVLRDAYGDYVVSMSIVVVGMAVAAVLGVVAGRASDEFVKRGTPARLR
jgi:MFS family permease